MYMMYVDESGDSGMHKSPTRYFALSGLVLHELRWSQYFDELLAFRRRLKATFGIGVRDEFHAADLITKPRHLRQIKMNRRIEMIRHYADALAGLTDLSVISVLVDKQGKPPQYDVFDMAWKALIQRFSNTMSHHNFRGPQNADDQGLLICDNTDNKKLTQLRRKMSRYNPIPHHPSHPNAGTGYLEMPIRIVTEDPMFKDSKESYFVQSVDLTAFLLYQSVAPNKQMRKFSGRNFFKRLQAIACVHASRSDRAMGVVSL